MDGNGGNENGSFDQSRNNGFVVFSVLSDILTVCDAAAAAATAAVVDAPAPTATENVRVALLPHVLLLLERGPKQRVVALLLLLLLPLILERNPRQQLTNRRDGEKDDESEDDDNNDNDDVDATINDHTIEQPVTTFNNVMAKRKINFVGFEWKGLMC